MRRQLTTLGMLSSLRAILALQRVWENSFNLSGNSNVISCVNTKASKKAFGRYQFLQKVSSWGSGGGGGNLIGFRVKVEVKGQFCKLCDLQQIP